MKNESYGAPLERGIIEKIEDEKYRVASLTRHGIKSLPIKSMDNTLSIGDKVYFFLFQDGEGLIISKI